MTERGGESQEAASSEEEMSVTEAFRAGQLAEVEAAKAPVNEAKMINKPQPLIKETPMADPMPAASKPVPKKTTKPAAHAQQPAKNAAVQKFNALPVANKKAGPVVAEKPVAVVQKEEKKLSVMEKYARQQLKDQEDDEKLK